MIAKLPVDVYQRIKAGEVIEDCASVVRELLDNSIDAKATQITVDISGGGLDRIIIKDNGEGMSSKDLALCFLEHTTSKICSFEDISTLKTNGFRGEALSSICRIARVNILSATQAQKTSEKIWISEGKIVKQESLAYRQGTIVEIEDIFYNLPVRKSFVRSKTRETSKIKREVIQKALSFPNITFQLISEGKTLLFCLPQKLEERLLALTRVKNPLHILEFESSGLSVYGIITGIDQVFDSSQELFVSLNTRPFASKVLYGTMKNALSQLIPRHKYLGGCIHITTSPSNIDPNIHPAKKELKLFNEDVLARGLYVGLRSIFYKSSYQTFLDLPQSPKDAPIPTHETGTNPSNPLIFQKEFSHFPEVKNNVLENNTSQNTLSFTSLSPKKENEPQTPKMIDSNLENILNPSLEIENPSYSYIGIYKGTYLIVEKDQNILLIDFHAAHERIRYENLKKQLEESSVEVQPLLSPLILPLSSDTWDMVEKSKEIWEEMGFEFDFLGDEQLLIRAIPSILGEKPAQTLLDFLETRNEGGPITIVDIKDRWLKFAACRKSYMAGDRLPENEVQNLLKTIFSGKIPLTCPHGRPFTLTLPYQNIANHFLR